MKEQKEEKSLDKIISALSPIERAILPYLHLHSAAEIEKESNFDKTKIKRALEFLANKQLVKLEFRPKKEIVLGDNGVIYIKQELPERRLLTALAEQKKLTLKEASSLAKLSENELSVALGMLKSKDLISFEKGIILLKGSEQEISKKFPEEKFLSSLPLAYSSLTAEQRSALEQLKKRKDIIRIEEAKELFFTTTSLGKTLLHNLEKIKKAEFIEALTPDMLRQEAWKGKTFRRYDITSKVPAIFGGKRHFVNQAVQYAKKIWLEMGFEEMKGQIINTAFWDFDALFVPQDHPAREMQDTFFLREKGKLPSVQLVKKVKAAHEKGTAGSKGWRYSWQEEEAKKLVLRTHTTVLSAQTLAKLKKADWPAKFFAIGRVYRNETLDWKHLFEFNQAEGIVVDPNANFRHLIGYLKEFFLKMGFPKARFRPSYFPYTEPSIEIEVFHPLHKKWIELGGAGIFRPEVTEPLLGEAVPVLAWGPGLDRLILDYYKITDIRELYSNNLSHLRKIKTWLK